MLLEEQISQIRGILYEEMTFKMDADELLNPVIKALEEKEKQDFIYNLLKEIIQFDVLQPEVKEKEDGYSFMTGVVLKLRRDLENKERQLFRQWVLKECFPKEMEAIKAIKKAFSSSSIYTNKLKDSLECGWITQDEYDLIKEEIVCQSEENHY